MEDKKKTYIGIAVCAIMTILAGLAVWWLIPHFSTAAKAVDTLLTYAAMLYLVAAVKGVVTALVKCLQ